VEAAMLVPPVDQKAHEEAALLGQPHPSVVGQYLRGRDTPEWAYYTSHWSDGLGIAFNGGGSRACSAHWGIMSSLDIAGYSKFLTYAFMSSNSGATWAILPLLYAPRANQGPTNFINDSKGSDCTVPQMLGAYVPTAFLTTDIIDVAITKELVGYGSTKMHPLSVLSWWGDVDSYFSIPRNIGQDSNQFRDANWQLCTFGQTDEDIEKEITVTSSGNSTTEALTKIFKVAE
jgi:hypothetical protein